MASLRQPESKHGPYPEGTTRVVTATVKDENGTPIPGASLTTMTWTLYSEHGALAIINSRNAVDIKPNVDSNGLLTLTLTPLDMAVLDDTLVEERHRALFQWTYSGGKAGKYEAQIVVSNMEKVT